jgi:hypothetical protein
LIEMCRKDLFHRVGKAAMIPNPVSLPNLPSQQTSRLIAIIIDSYYY